MSVGNWTLCRQNIGERMKVILDLEGEPVAGIGRDPWSFDVFKHPRTFPSRD
jgi:hypothetical protein